MTKHERRTEELMHLISDELIDVVFYAALRNTGNRDGAWIRVRGFQTATRDLRSRMYDELNEPRGFRKLAAVFGKLFRSTRIKAKRTTNREAPIDEQQT